MDPVWDAVKALPLDQRNFDHQNAALSHFAVPALGEAEPVPSSVTVWPREGHIAGTLMAIAHLAAYVAETLSCDPDVRSKAELIAGIAAGLEDQARGLRHILNLCLEQHDNEAEET